MEAAKAEHPFIAGGCAFRRSPAFFFLLVLSGRRGNEPHSAQADAGTLGFVQKSP